MHSKATSHIPHLLNLKKCHKSTLYGQVPVYPLILYVCSRFGASTTYVLATCFLAANRNLLIIRASTILYFHLILPSPHLLIYSQPSGYQSHIKQIKMSYQILEASIPTDLAALARVNCSARQDEPLWRLLMRNVSAEDELEFTVRNFRDRAVVDDMLYFKAVERESGFVAFFYFPSL